MSDVVPNPSAIHVNDLRAGYGAREVLHGVHLNVTAGETFGLIGLNGAGKTTLVKTILGLKDPMSGTVDVFGRSTQNAAARYDISYLPERFDPPWFLTGGEFIDFAASLYGRGVSNDEKKRFCNLLALDPDVLPRRVQTYSKGMRQKLGLIATVLTGCQILIFDEPMSGLDPLARALVKGMFLDLKTQGRTVLLSSHILSDMDEICDRVMVVHQGDTPYLGTTEGMKTQTAQETLEKAFLKIINAESMLLGKAA